MDKKDGNTQRKLFLQNPSVKAFLDASVADTDEIAEALFKNAPHGLLMYSTFLCEISDRLAHLSLAAISEYEARRREAEQQVTEAEAQAQRAIKKARQP